MKRLALLLLASLIAACNETSTDASSTPPVSAQAAAIRAQFAVPLLLPDVPPGAPSPQFVTTDITRVDYTCAAGALTRLPASRDNYPGRALKICVDVHSFEAVESVIANNIRSLCAAASGAALASVAPDLLGGAMPADAIFAIRAFNDLNKPAQVRLTGVPCRPADVLSP